MTGGAATYRRISGQFPEIRTPWKAVAAELRYAIEHDMVPGEPLPSANATAQMYEVHRNTVRKAFAAMAAEGLIELVSGRGYFVVLQGWSPPPVGRVRDEGRQLVQLGRPVESHRGGERRVALALGAHPGQRQRAEDARRDRLPQRRGT